MNEVRLICPPRLDQESGKPLLDEFRRGKAHAGGALVFDLSKTEEMDTRGAAWLVEIADFAHRYSCEVRCEGQHGAAARMLEIIEPSLAPRQYGLLRKESLFDTLADKTLAFIEETVQFMGLCVDAIYWTLIGPLEGKGFRWGLFIDEIHEMGVRAVRIVGLMNFLLGLIIAMLSSAQVASFGLSIYVANLLMIGFARELAAIMTATVVSARTGAAIAAEIATMEVQEEIDALRGMGINVAQFLVAPKVLALLIVLPCLVALGMVCGLLGGAAWGVFVLGFEPSVWFRQTLQAAMLSDVVQGMLKTIVFAIGIVLIGCHNGFRVTGGSRGVGLMTTRAVVMDIFMLICVDIIFAAIFYYVLK